MGGEMVLGSPYLPGLVVESCGCVGLGPVEEGIFLERTKRQMVY